MKTFTYLFLFLVCFLPQPRVWAEGEKNPSSAAEELDLPQGIIDNSPVIQKWLKQIPDVAKEIRYTPSFKTLLRFGYSQFPSSHHTGGFSLAIEDLFIANTPLTVSAQYSQNFEEASRKQKRQTAGGTIQYYLLPLGEYVNVAPLVGYKYIKTGDYVTEGLNVGIKLKLALSPGGGGDLSVTQSFLSPTSSDEVGMTEITAGYALTKSVRLFSGIGWQNSLKRADSQVTVGLELLLK